MKFKQPPLKIDCSGLNKNLLNELAGRLAWHFEDIYIVGDTIYADTPRDNFHYEEAWNIIDKFGVRAA